MKLIWSPETASKAYIDTVKSCELFRESSVAELISAMAAGWNARLVVETWSHGGATATSVGLAVAAHHTGGRHICMVPDEESRSEYIEAMKRSGRAAEVIVGQPEEAVEGLEGIDFLVVDSTRNEFTRILRAAKLGQRGAVLVGKNAGGSPGSRWRDVVEPGMRIVRSVFLPVGQGLDIAHVGARGVVPGKGQSRWIKHVDHQTGEEIVIRK